MPSSPDSDIESILARCQTQTLGLYVIGAFAHRVTIYSQQCRAYNLIWAMFQRNLINSDSAIAVVGGGFSGLTAAVAAASKGCRVTIYERYPEVLQLQARCGHRYVHPTIYDWPATDSIISATDFPWLNWNAANAEDIVAEVREGWEQARRTYKRLNVEPIDIKQVQPGPPLQLVDANNIPLHEPFNAIILSVGFGDEAALTNAPERPYWREKINPRSTPHVGKSEVHWFVSGVGDGGLIDALNLVLSDFQHKRFTKEVVEKFDFPGLWERLLKIDNDAYARQALDLSEDVSSFILAEYDKIILPPELDDYIREQMLSRTEKGLKVTLNGQTAALTNLGSSILNRYMVYLLYRKKVIRYVTGSVETRKNAEDLYEITLNGHKLSEYFDDVLIRHGVERPAVQPFLDDNTIKRLTNLHRTSPDPTREQLWHQWDPGFYAGSRRPRLRGNEESDETTEIVGLSPLDKRIIGRYAEAAILLEAMRASSGTNIVCFYGPAGIGKSAIINEWLEFSVKTTKPDADQTYAYSFFGQGEEGATVSASDFINRLCLKFGHRPQLEDTSEEIGRALGRLIRNKSIILVLDGLEPLQYDHNVEEGRIRDPGLAALLAALAERNKGLCVITSRIPIPELQIFGDPNVRTSEVKPLSLEDATKVLQRYCLNNHPIELSNTWNAIWQDTLALNLLGQYTEYYENGILADALQALPQDPVPHVDSPVPRILQAFEQRLSPNGKSVMYLIGLFSRPATIGALAELRQSNMEALAKFVEPLQTDVEWKKAVVELQQVGLLYAPSSSPQRINTIGEQAIDTHPSIREYFAKRMRDLEREAIWRQGHECLFEYYCNKIAEIKADETFDNTNVNAKRLTYAYLALSHGCHSGQYGKAFDLYIEEIRRDKEHYSWKKKGAVSEDLAALMPFYKARWTTLVGNADLRSDARVLILKQTGLYLGAMGLMDKAEEPQRIALRTAELDGLWNMAADAARNLSELYQITGHLARAHVFAVHSISAAEQMLWDHGKGREYELYKNYAALGAVLLDKGNQMGAANAFEASLHWQKEAGGWARFLDTMIPDGRDNLTIASCYADFRYGEYLIETGQTPAAERLADEWYRHANSAGYLMAIALSRLLQCEVKSCSNEINDWYLAWDYAGDVVDYFQQANTLHHLPRGYLARAKAYTRLGEHNLALSDVESALQLCLHGGFKLLQADCLLEQAKIFMSLGGEEQRMEQAVQDASILIRECQYHRRLESAQELQGKLGL